METPTYGYSGKLLIQKLGFKPGAKVCTINAPAHYTELLGPEYKSVNWVTDPDLAECIHLFAKNTAVLEENIPVLAEVLKPGKMLWVSWPKKSSLLFQDLTEDAIRNIALPMGLVDIKVCAIDADWSGLKLVWRKVNDT